MGRLANHGPQQRLVEQFVNRKPNRSFTQITATVGSFDLLTVHTHTHTDTSLHHHTIEGVITWWLELLRAVKASFED